VLLKCSNQVPATDSDVEVRWTDDIKELVDFLPDTWQPVDYTTEI